MLSEKARVVPLLSKFQAPGSPLRKQKRWRNLFCYEVAKTAVIYRSAKKSRLETIKVPSVEMESRLDGKDILPSTVSRLG